MQKVLKHFTHIFNLKSDLIITTHEIQNKTLHRYFQPTNIYSRVHFKLCSPSADF